MIVRCEFVASFQSPSVTARHRFVAVDGTFLVLVVDSVTPDGVVILEGTKGKDILHEHSGPEEVGSLHVGVGRLVVFVLVVLVNGIVDGIVLIIQRFFVSRGWSMVCVLSPFVVKIGRGRAVGLLVMFFFVFLLLVVVIRGIAFLFFLTFYFCMLFGIIGEPIGLAPVRPRGLLILHLCHSSRTGH